MGYISVDCTLSFIIFAKETVTIMAVLQIIFFVDQIVHVSESVDFVFLSLKNKKIKITV